MAECFSRLVPSLKSSFAKYCGKPTFRFEDGKSGVILFFSDEQVLKELRNTKKEAKKVQKEAHPYEELEKMKGLVAFFVYLDKIPIRFEGFEEVDGKKILTDYWLHPMLGRGI